MCNSRPLDVRDPTTLQVQTDSPRLPTATLLQEKPLAFHRVCGTRGAKDVSLSGDGRSEPPEVVVVFGCIQHSKPLHKELVAQIGQAVVRSEEDIDRARKRVLPISAYRHVGVAV